MLKASDTKENPWFIVPSDDKKRARLNCIHHLLSRIPYRKVSRDRVKLSDRSMKDATTTNGH
jgi:polyphosphate kinase